MPDLVPIARVFRGSRVESDHLGRFVVTRGGEVLLSGGDLERHVFYRSASKAIQALVAVTSGAAACFGFGDEALAIAAGSHSGTPDQVEVVQDMLDRAGIPEAALQCGPQWPFHKPSAKALRQSHETPLRVWNNCSGKHAAMLAAAKAMDTPLDTYLAPSHPVQREIVRHVALLAEIPEAAVGVAVDGCSAPTFSVPMLAAAHSIRRLLDPEGTGDLAEAVGAVVRAWAAHPHLIAGPGRIDTVLMEGSASRLLAKGGAEGVHVVADADRDLVYVVKCADGSPRGSDALIVALLERVGSVTPAEAAAIRSALSIGPVENRDGQVVGRVEAVLPDAS